MRREKPSGFDLLRVIRPEAGEEPAGFFDSLNSTGLILKKNTRITQLVVFVRNTHATHPFDTRLSF